MFSLDNVHTSCAGESQMSHHYSFGVGPVVKEKLRHGGPQRTCAPTQERLCFLGNCIQALARVRSDKCLCCHQNGRFSFKLESFTLTKNSFFNKTINNRVIDVNLYFIMGLVFPFQKKKVF